MLPPQNSAHAPRRAAVLVPIVASDDPVLVLVRRPGHMRRHAGQVACPGGIYEAADGDVLVTALRETEEEIGIPRAAVKIVRRITDVFTLNSNFLITPFVGVIRPPIDLRIDAAEIAAVYEVPLTALLAEGAVHYGEERVGDRRVATWLFDHGEVHVWGATGRILHEFVSVFRDGAPAAELAEAVERARAGVS